jgi:hypothetical protein
MWLKFSGQVPKDVEYPQSNEDAFVVDQQRAVAAVSDGASESFDSKTWANLLSTAFCRCPAVHAEWAEQLAQDYELVHEPSSLSWSKRAAFDRGSFATLLGVEYSAIHSSLDVLAIGDSIAALIQNDKLIETFPYRTALEFQQRPQLLCTQRSNNAFLHDSNFYSMHSMTWKIPTELASFVLLMTDALAEWAIRGQDEGLATWRTLLDIDSEESLQALVSTEREARRMRIDDVTLVCLGF